jgi:hypothetical protein
MADTFWVISSVTVGGGGAASIEFTNIPATYTDLIIKASLRDTRNGPANDLGLEINGSAANRRYRAVNGNGSSTVSTFGGTATTIGVQNGDTSAASVFGNFELYIPNYANGSNKSMFADSIQETTSTTAEQWFLGSLWSQTNAITSLKLIPGSGYSYMQYSTAILYGINNTV